DVNGLPLRVDACLALRVRIVDRRQRRLAVQVQGQVAPLPRFVRDRHHLRSRTALLETLIVEEEEGAILAVVDLRNPHRSSQCETELVELESRPGGSEVAA